MMKAWPLSHAFILDTSPAPLRRRGRFPGRIRRAPSRSLYLAHAKTEEDSRKLRAWTAIVLRERGQKLGTVMAANEREAESAAAVEINPRRRAAQAPRVFCSVSWIA